MASEDNAAETRAIDEEAVLAYDLKNLSAPRVSGIAARLLVYAVEGKLLGPFLKRKVMRDSGFVSFGERTEISAQSLRYPLLYPLPASPEHPLEFEEVDNFFQSAWGKNDKVSNKRQSVRDYSAAYRSGNVSPIHVCEAILKLIQATNDGSPPLKAVTSVNEDSVRSEAAASAERWSTGRPISVLDGVPFFVKDMILARDGLHGTTGGVGFLVASPPPADTKDGNVVAALRKAGMIMIAKTHTTEIGMGVRGYNRCMGQARNPWNLNRVPGGSSSGSGAVVAAGLAPIALGSDGGGSIRIPAACCGIFGLKPTYARLSLNGRFFQTDGEDDAPDSQNPVPSEPPTTTNFGPLALCADDLALSYFVLASHAPHGPIRDEPDFTGRLIEALPSSLDASMEGLRIGVCKPWVEDTSSAALAHFRRALSALQGAGAVICAVAIPCLDDIRCAHTIAIASSTYKQLELNGAMRDENWAQIGIDTRMKMHIASGFDDVFVQKADSVRAKAINEIVKKLFTEVDVLLTPALGMDVPEVPQNLETGLLNASADSNLMRFMGFANFTGVPAASIPVGIDEENGLPYSVQVIAGPWQEVLLLQMSKFLEDCLSPKSACPPMAFDVLEEAAKIKSQMNGSGE